MIIYDSFLNTVLHLQLFYSAHCTEDEWEICEIECANYRLL